MEKLIVLTGPTAVGKTNLSIKLAKEVKGEIISCDSMQVYRDMNIGTDKITPEKMGGVPHHMIDILDPDEDFNAFEFKKRVLPIIDEIHKRGKIPILVGGTGFYIQSVLYDVQFSENDDEDKDKESLAYKDELLRISKEDGGVSKLHQMLMEIDPEYAKEVHENNVKRVMRALSFYHDTGEKMSVHNSEQRENQSPYDFFYFVLTDDRDVLYKRIEDRIDMMIEEGLEEEVRELCLRNIDRSATSMQALGYREMLSYIDGDMSLDEAISLIKKNTRHFAKRQLTWFKREKTVTWIDKSMFDRDDSRVLDEILRQIRERWEI